MNIVEKAVKWAVDTAKDDSFYYSWGGWGPKGYDCGHFVITAYRKAGLSLSNATYTGDMRGAFISDGFKDVTSQVNLRSGAGMLAGDVLIDEYEHAAMVQTDGGITVEALSSNDGIVYNKPYRDHPWDYVLRYPITKSSTSIPEVGTIQGVKYGTAASDMMKKSGYKQYKGLFEKYGKQYNIDPMLLAAIAMQESSLNQDSNNGYAVGLMQIENTLTDELAQRGYNLQDRFNAEKNVDFGAWRLSQLFKRYGSDLLKVVQAYNFSEYTVDAIIRKVGNDRWFSERRNAGIYNGTGLSSYGDPEYVEHVFRYWRPKSLDGRYTSSSDYMYGENAYSDSETEEYPTVIWHERKSEVLCPRLINLPPLPAVEACDYRIFADDIDITRFSGNISWSDSIEELALTLSFSVFKSDNAYIKDIVYNPVNGSVIRVQRGNAETFRGIIMKTDDGSKLENRYSAYDMLWYLNKTEQTYQFEGITTMDAIRQIFTDLNVPILYITDKLSNYSVTKIYFSQTVSDIIKDILSLCGGGYCFYCVPEGVRIISEGETTVKPKLMVAPNAAGADSTDYIGNVSHSVSWEEMKTSVKIVSQKDKTYTELTVKQNDELMKSVGFIQKIVSIDPDKENAEQVADEQLTKLSMASETYGCDIITALDDDVRSGYAIDIKDIRYIITGTKQSIKNGRKYVSLELRRQ